MYSDNNWLCICVYHINYFHKSFHIIIVDSSLSQTYVYADQGIKFTPEDPSSQAFCVHSISTHCGNRMDTKLVACDEAEDLLVLYTIILMSVTLYGLYSALFFL